MLLEYDKGYLLMCGKGHINITSTLDVDQGHQAEGLVKEYNYHKYIYKILKCLGICWVICFKESKQGHTVSGNVRNKRLSDEGLKYCAEHPIVTLIKVKPYQE